MREIKFRGKLQKEYTPQGWVYGDLVKYVGNHYIMDDGCNWDILESGYKVIPETVGQFTGLLDKNGVKIFKGDLVSTDLERPYNIVEFMDGCFVFNCKDDEVIYFDIMQPLNTADKTLAYHEVIGNIHDNPELLESE